MINSLVADADLRWSPSLDWTATSFVRPSRRSSSPTTSSSPQTLGPVVGSLPQAAVAPREVHVNVRYNGSD